MKTVLICHDGATLNQEGLTRWMGSFSDLVGVVVLRERPERKWRRIRREIRRVGLLRFPDVVAMRLYYKLVLSRRDQRWEQRELARLKERYPPLPDDLPVLHTHSPNTPEAEAFIRSVAPDLMVARCKTLIKESVFTIPELGTFVFHPGICPEYRNAHGAFWALANGELDKVGMTLLRIDKGVDTGPVYGFYSYPFDEVAESHIVIQYRVVFDNLDALRDRLLEVEAGTAAPIDTTGRESDTWGQPWLSRYLGWKRRARKRAQPAGARIAAHARQE